MKKIIPQWDEYNIIQRTSAVVGLAIRAFLLLVVLGLLIKGGAVLWDWAWS